MIFNNQGYWEEEIIVFVQWGSVFFLLYILAPPVMED